MSRFVYTPADQTDLKESFKRYKEMVRNESSDRKIHSGEPEPKASPPNPPSREVLCEQEQGVQRLRLIVAGGEG